MTRVRSTTLRLARGRRYGSFVMVGLHKTLFSPTDGPGLAVGVSKHVQFLGGVLADWYLGSKASSLVVMDMPGGRSRPLSIGSGFIDPWTWKKRSSLVR